MPRHWFIAHRCVDISEKCRVKSLAALIKDGEGEENALSSMDARFRDGFGVETDLRADSRADEAGILISHNPPVKGGGYSTLAEVFGLYNKHKTGGCLALNIKDAGLQDRLKPMLDQYGIANYFTFDGANPDVLVDGKSGITAFGRESEIEPFNAAHAVHPLSNYPSIKGVWLDNFDPNPWISKDVIARHFQNGKDVCIVSCELHPWARGDASETVLRYWTQYRAALRDLRASYPDRRMMICTKMPSFAFSFFNGEGD